MNALKKLNFTKGIFLIVFFLGPVSAANAQTLCDPDFEICNDIDVPLDSGATYLLIAGALIAAWKIRKTTKVRPSADL